jgi:hypothetical protein
VALAAVPLLMVQLLGAARAWQRIGLAVALFAVSASLLNATAATWVPLLRGAGCLSLWLSGVIGPALVLRSVAELRGSGALYGALVGTAVFSGGATLQRALCDLGGAAHVVVFHLLPWLLGVAAMAVLATQLRPTGRAQRAS